MNSRTVRWRIALIFVLTMVLVSSAHSINRTPIQTYTGFWHSSAFPGDVLFGSSLAAKEDVNASGDDFLLVGAPAFDSDYDNGGNEGRAYLYAGDLSDGTATDHHLIGLGGDDRHGTSVAMVDAYTDGTYPDLVVGAPDYGAGDSGRVMLYLGDTVQAGSGGPASPYSPRAYLQPSTPVAGDGFGTRMTDLGYFDEPSTATNFYGDVAIASPGFVGTTGKVYTFLGGSS